MTDIEWAIQTTVHRQRGLSKKLADVIGTSQQVLLNKVNPEIPTNHLTAAEALKIMAYTDDVVILEIMASELGYTLCKEESKTVPVLDALLNVIVNQGDVGKAIKDSIEDGVIDVSEERYTLAQINELRKRLGDLESSVKQHARKTRHHNDT